MEQWFHDVEHTPGGVVAGTQAVDRAADLLVRVLESGRPVSFAELSDGAALAKSTTSRLLSALESSRLIMRDEHGAVLPGSAVIRYARAFDRHASLARTVRPGMERVVELTGETANLAVASGGAVDLVDQVDGTYLLGSMNWVGQNVPPHASALGKVLIAHGLLARPTGRLHSVTAHTIVTAAEFDREIAAVLSSGVATIRDELEIGLAAVAVPVRDERGDVVAAVSLSGPTARFDERRIVTISTLLRDEFVGPAARKRRDRGSVA